MASRTAFNLSLAVVTMASTVSFLTLNSQSIRLDEAQSIWVTTKSLPVIMKLTGQDVLVPLYPLLLHFWLQIFGTAVPAARLLSFIFYLVSLPLLYLFGRELGNKNVALIGILLYALSPFIMWYSNETRMYTLFLLTTCVNHYFFIRLLKTQAREGKFGFVISSIIGLYTHYFFIFLLASQGFYLLLKIFGILHHFDKDNFNFSRFFLFYLLLILISLLAFSPWIFYMLKLGGAQSTQPLIPPPTSFNIFQTLVTFIFGFQNTILEGLFISLWPLLVLLLFFFFTKRQKIPLKYLDYLSVITFIPILLVFLVSYIRPIFLSRYLILTTPTLFLIIAWLIVSYAKKAAGLAVVLVLFIMFAFSLSQNVSSETPVKENYQAAAFYLNNHVSPSDIIAVSAPFTIYPLEYYYEGITKIDTIPLWDRYTQGGIPSFTDRNLIIQIKGYQKQYQRLWLVLSYNQGYEDKILKYLDTHYQLDNTTRFSSGLKLRVYRLRYDL